jgi:predicted adenylyl cyclase CyaB
MKNIEIKALAPLGLEEARERIRALGDFQWKQRQKDTFYKVPAGRLKIREEYEGGDLQRAELIPYVRPDLEGPKESEYSVIPLPSPEETAGLFSRILGVSGVVTKTRELWLLYERSVRVHLDEVEGLGEFLEIEAVVSDDSPAELQARRVDELLGALGIEEEHLIKRAYVDMLGKE